MNYRSRYKNSQLLKERKAEEKFKRVTLIGLGTFLLIGSTVWILAYYGCEIRYKYRMKALYGKVVPVDLICMSGNYLMKHKTLKFVYKDKVFQMCSENCEIGLINDFNELAFTKDTISGNLINKADAIPGLRQKNRPEIIYFGDMKNLRVYYKNEKKKH